ncbi:hypothetical protein BN1723_018849 [Verticillium longisporum]|uniref:Uncharacterized protein n=1 Tax=Verticillium longisporum TaxID=100787 RepID=A0A0G4N5K3_VERLO|nr:hypothetical protein BN1723_018849 [Verticillium longisporum]
MLANAIGRAEFDELLASYESVLESISAAKEKPGQKTLKELDQFRYVEAPRLFSQHGTPERPMNHDDVKVLVDWKLRHGKFRPNLMKLVTSNDSSAVSQTIQDGISTFEKTSDVAKALATLAKLKGIGPATASLLLAVHRPDDESLKYNMKEYDELILEARALMKRLEVSAMDVEKVSYVVMRRGDAGVKPLTANTRDSKASKEEAGNSVSEKDKSKPSTATKRKSAVQNEAANQTSLRRSKRGKPSS